ncbi:MAG: hypothetical protein SGJ27_04555 [Candidatus Melainabacteria bacterium]|nr:hypothetical protein [Candidatus Melainabacteria bacterium]
MSSRALVISISAALIAVTGYGVINTLDKGTALSLKKNVAAFINNPFEVFEKPKYENAIAQKYGGTDPHGPDPHGDDPHDEIHDPGLPANADRNVGKAPKDVYGGTVNNDQKPY